VPDTVAEETRGRVRLPASTLSPGWQLSRRLLVALAILVVTDGATFTHPITLSIYAMAGTTDAPTVGAELASFISAGWSFGIGGACFPEVHPEAPDLETDLRYLKSKVDAGASFLITQLFFDNQVYFDFVRAARARGIEVPILAGIIPVAGFAQTKRICSLCDATIPPALEAAFEAAGGDPQREFELGIAYAAQQCAELLIAGCPGIHFYALNRAPATLAVLGALKASRPWERVRGDAAEMERAE